MLAQTAETIKGVIEGVDKASMAGDRWLFIAALVLLLGFAGLVIKWLVGTIEVKDKAHSEERKIMDAEIKQERTESRAQRKEDQAIFIAEFRTISNDLKMLTKAQEKNTEVLIEHDKEMRDSHKMQLRSAVHEEMARLGLLKQDIGS
jgi:cobalamin biosynthesis protein CbiD